MIGRSTFPDCANEGEFCVVTAKEVGRVRHELQVQWMHSSMQHQNKLVCKPSFKSKSQEPASRSFLILKPACDVEDVVLALLHPVNVLLPDAAITLRTGNIEPERGISWMTMLPLRLHGSFTECI